MRLRGSETAGDRKPTPVNGLAGVQIIRVQMLWDYLLTLAWTLGFYAENVHHLLSFLGIICRSLSVGSICMCRYILPGT